MDELMKVLEEYHQRTGGKCGQTLVALCRKTGYNLNQLKNLLNQAHTAGKIIVREGINGKLIILKK